MSAQRTRPATFEVVDRQTNHVWLKLLESEDAGMRFAVPIRHERHDDELEETLDRARTGQRFELALAEDLDGDSGSYVHELVDTLERLPSPDSAPAQS